MLQGFVFRVRAWGFFCNADLLQLCRSNYTSPLHVEAAVIEGSGI